MQNRNPHNPRNHRQRNPQALPDRSESTFPGAKKKRDPKTASGRRFGLGPKEDGRVYKPRKGPQGHLHASRSNLREKPEIETVQKFSSVLRDVAQEMGLREKLDAEPAPLAKLDYETELKLKSAAIRKFWTLHNLPDKPSLVIPSPKPRHYRSTSKRRIIRKGARWEWDFFLERMGAGKSDHEILEPLAHEAIYKQALEKLNEAPYRGLANSLNFLIVRGHPDLMVIFNVFRLNAEVVRKARMLVEHLANREGSGVKAAYLFYDASRSTYYIEAQVSPGPFRVKQLLGSEYLPVTVEGRRYFLHPTGFFQVNPSILPRVIEEVQNALKPLKGDRFLDLYCGCGLFTFPIAEGCHQTVGVEMSPVSIEAARKSQAAGKIHNIHFVAGKIEPSRLPKLIPPTDGRPEIMLLDPARQGTAPGLIHALAERKPRRVAHLFCDMDVMPAEIGKWRKQGYMVAKVLPFDMFPGTDNLEVLVVLLPDKFGLLNRKKPKPAIEKGPFR